MSEIINNYIPKTRAEKKNIKPSRKRINKYLKMSDIDKINIEGVYDGDTLVDILVHYPEGYKNKTISFVDIGLVNLDGEVNYHRNQSSYGIVTLQFYGKYKEVELSEYA